MRRASLTGSFAAAAFAAFVAIASMTGVAHAQGGVKPKTAEDDVERLSRAGDGRAIGPDSAKVTLIEFLDYACPTCRAFHLAKADSLRRMVGPDVRIAYFTFLITDHLRAFHGAEAALCGGFVGGSAGYLKMADAIFSNQDEWKDALDPSPLFDRYAKGAGLDAAAYAECRARDAVAPMIVSDLYTADKFEVQGTPTFVVMPRGATGLDQTFRTSGNVPVKDILDLVAQARAKAK